MPWPKLERMRNLIQAKEISQSVEKVEGIEGSKRSKSLGGERVLKKVNKQRDSSTLKLFDLFDF